MYYPSFARSAERGKRPREIRRRRQRSPAGSPSGRSSTLGDSDLGCLGGGGGVLRVIMEGGIRR